MPELRCNPLTGQWVIIAENRWGRPHDVAVQHVVREEVDCPFCEGREHQTPGELLAYRELGTLPNTPGWRVRVVPNKYPALLGRPVEVDETESAQRTSAAADGTRSVHTLKMQGYGRHEIFIESPRHLSSVTELSDAEFTEVLDIYRQRLLSLAAKGCYREALLFKNSGPAAGATLGHLHSQLIVPQLPQRIDHIDRSRAFQQHFERSGECLLCQLAGQETAEGIRLVAQSRRFIAFCPFASRFAYETWIIPRDHQSQYHQLDPKSLPELAGLFRMVLSRIERLVNPPAYNYIFHTAPFDAPQSDHYHWHIEILPRSAGLAGFELGMGCYLNTVRPELAAAALRKV